MTNTSLVVSGLRVLIASALVFIAACSQHESLNEDDVTIYRDVWGVPHIYASEEQDGFYGLGYAQAEDQLGNLLGAIYWIDGRRAELEGPALLSVDIEQRRWRHAAEGKSGLSRLEPQVRANYEHYVAGVRRYMRDHPDKVPAWAPQLEAADFLAISRAIFWTAYAGVLGPAECAAPGIELHSSIQSVADAQLKGASNGWVVAPRRSADGSTILLADPHTELQSPAYYEFRMHAGNLNSSGFSIGPLLWQAHNDNVSWAMTTGNPDMWDCYAVEVDPEDHTRYLFDGEWRDLVQIDETFNVLGGESVSKTFEYTKHNGVLSPVVAWSGNTAYVVSTSQMHDTGLLDNEIWRMNQATTVFELREAMATLGMYPQNIIAGDSSGNLYYLRAGKTPIRPAIYDWTKPVPGNSSASAWQGYHDLDDLVEILNPAQDFLQNNNVAPDAMFAADNLSISDYAPGVFNDTAGRVTTRGLRSIEVLSAAEQFTVADAKELAFDETWVTAKIWVDALRYALHEYPQWPDEQNAETRSMVRRLLSFDGVAAADSVAALNFYYWRAGMPAVLQRQGFEHLQTLPWSEDDFSPEFAAAILRQIEVAASAMVEEFGSTDVAMGSVFRVGRGERSWPLGGETIDAPEIPSCVADLSPLCDRTLRAFASSASDADGQRRAYRGSNSMRLVVFSEPVQSWSLHVFGQSDDPKSPHYDDQAKLLSERKFKPTFFHWNDLDKNVESTTVLEINEAVDQ